MKNNYRLYLESMNQPFIYKNKSWDKDIIIRWKLPMLPFILEGEYLAKLI